MTKYHPSAMIHEIKQFLVVQGDSKFDFPLKVVDATLGDGGHSELFLKSGCHVLGIDMDIEAIERAQKRLSSINFEDGILFECFQSRHSEIKNILEKKGWVKCDIVFADLGARLDQLYREDMSFHGSEEADMRFDKTEDVLKASQILNSYSEVELRSLFKHSGVKNYKKISSQIVRDRHVSSMPCNQLSKILIENGVKKNHPSTKIFMALRREVNKEAEELSFLLNSLPQVISAGGISMFLTWHSLEDKQVKNFYKKIERMGFGEILTKRPIEPCESEIEKMPQVRSAKLRVFKFKN